MTLIRSENEKAKSEQMLAELKDNYKRASDELQRSIEHNAKLVSDTDTLRVEIARLGKERDVIEKRMIKEVSFSSENVE